MKPTIQMIGIATTCLHLLACVEMPAPQPNCQTTEQSFALDQSSPAGSALELSADLNRRPTPLGVDYEPRRNELRPFSDDFTLDFSPSSARWVEPGISGPSLPHCPTYEHLQVRGMLTITSIEGLNIEREAQIMATEPGIGNAILSFSPLNNAQDTAILLPLVELPAEYATHLSDIPCSSGATAHALWLTLDGPIGSPLSVGHNVSMSSDCGMSLYNGRTEPW